ncbi:MAG: TauD/TfdA family dioxygenase, partial [Pseudomonadota bacterium]|nr:TauD/TfdA family dioxygenase [Pseudomonadota bacterium]
MSLSIENSDGPIGASISGIDLTAEISKDDFTTVREVIEARAVMVIRGQTDLKSSDLVRFARRFGTPQVNVRAEANNDANPEVFWVSNVHENGKPLGSHDAGRY